MMFTKHARLKFYYNNTEVEIVSIFTCLGIVFTTLGSFKQTFDSLHGQALKPIFKLKSVLNKELGSLSAKIGPTSESFKVVHSES